MTHPIIHALVEMGTEPAQTREPEARTTEAVVASMLRENTGSHMLDSGGAYGRNWEHNQQRKFDNELEVTADWRYGWIDITLNLYHFLTNTLEYESELDRLFEEWCNEGERKHESWFVLQEEFVEELRQADDGNPDEPFATFVGQVGDNPYTGDSFREQPWTINTYNHESLLSQVIQFTLVGNLVFLQVHGGCDVRGGYTQPRVFRVFDEWPQFLDDQHATIFCDDGCTTPSNWGDYDIQSSWATDDGYHWYFDGGTGDTQLEEHPTADIAEPEGFAQWRARRIVLDVLEEHGEETDLLPIRAYHGEENYSLCPTCDTGKLIAGY